ncbi:uncharacterized protein LOC141689517 [Apium graveolens]|uniref:uncharacterized protein LOC141689517 n=1 Tax=Apium graveolens TaxID=4045 RepID=UPI003D7A247A
MAPPRIPKSFGAHPGDKPKPKPKRDASTAQASVPTPTPVPQTTPVLKRPVIDLTEKQGTPKRPRTEGAPSGSSAALNSLGPMGSIHVTDEEVGQWKTMNLEEATRASIKASCHLFIHSTQVVDKLLEEKACLERLQGDNNILKNTLKDTNFLHVKDIKTKDSEISFLKDEVANLTSQLEISNKKATSLHTELGGANLRIEYLEEQQKMGWPDEKREITDEAFANGFHFYRIGFMANDPDYTFERFGEETVAEMVEFKREHATEIKARRIELGLEEDDEGAPREEVSKDAPEVDPTVPLQTIPPTDESQGVP